MANLHYSSVDKTKLSSLEAFVSALTFWNGLGWDFPQNRIWLIFRLSLHKLQRETSPKNLLLVKPPGWVGGGVRPASQNPYPIYHQNLRYSLPYLWPDQKFKTLIMTWLLNQNRVSDQRYNKFPSSNQC